MPEMLYGQRAHRLIGSAVNRPAGNSFSGSSSSGLNRRPGLNRRYGDGRRNHSHRMELSERAPH